MAAAATAPACSTTASGRSTCSRCATGSVDVADLARRFGVTTETIRRDLSDMQSRRLLRRVHGGAVPIERMNHEPMVEARDMRQRRGEAADRRRAAVAEVPERGSVIIDSGSTGQRLAEVFPVDARRARRHQLADHRAHAEPARAARAHRARRRRCGRTVTRWSTRPTRAELQTLAVDVLFISCDGLSFQHGLTTPYREEHTIKRAMIERAREVVAIVDASKFGNEQMFSFAVVRRASTCW